MVNLNNCKTGYGLKNRAGYYCTYLHKTCNGTHVVKGMNMFTYCVDENGRIDKFSEASGDIVDIILRNDGVPSTKVNMNKYRRGEALLNRGGFIVHYSHKERADQHVVLDSSGKYIVNDFGFIDPNAECHGDILGTFKDSFDFTNLPEGVTELVVDGKRYVKRTVTKTQWEQVS